MLKPYFVFHLQIFPEFYLPLVKLVAFVQFLFHHISNLYPPFLSLSASSDSLMDTPVSTRPLPTFLPKYYASCSPPSMKRKKISMTLKCCLVWPNKVMRNLQAVCYPGSKRLRSGVCSKRTKLHCGTVQGGHKCI